ncbi:hypothetical protein [Aestuariibaculum marinum]|uniref:Uncharacterized protein n=1 Tax=Aestuariibaculum marinum TaxID=2683592 RepID=A0A8J6PT72_9FLAO|nr:hypothetical protein [Aestuariibaculum marinum]MBD0822661.1 hypothetical protein [Aestuariibaculum marinum]
MTKILNQITSYRNWIGKLILWVLGLVMVISQNWGMILKGFLLTEKEIHLDIAIYMVINSFGLLFIVGGIYLNKFLDKFTNSKTPNEP